MLSSFQPYFRSELPVCLRVSNLVLTVLFSLQLIDTDKGLTTCGLFDSSLTKTAFNNSTIVVSTKCLCSIEDLLFYQKWSFALELLGA